MGPIQRRNRNKIKNKKNDIQGYQLKEQEPDIFIQGKYPIYNSKS